MTQVVGLISWWPKQLFQGFQYSHFCSSSPGLPPTTVNDFSCSFLLLIAMKPHVYIIVCSKCQLMIFYHKSVIMHTYLHIYIYTLTCKGTPTYLHNVLPNYTIVVIWWYLTNTHIHTYIHIYVFCQRSWSFDFGL